MHRLNDPCPLEQSEPVVESRYQDGEWQVWQLRIQPELIWFKGHFSSLPLLPGVTQTGWAVIFGRRTFSLPPQFSSMSNIKFMRFIMPGEVLSLRLRYEAAKQILNFEYRNDGRLCASGRLSFV